ncbi:putative PEP-binding protein [Anabaena sp. FACHB-709]|uniref:Phosphoenolpyruvate synthase n=2 Tax=Nostocaceae TaxID=1162 RepID=A0A1Z4KJA6_ANAVA|nr:MULTISPECIES: putative PEP-binding protein [Nostocaceae]BAY69027.1 phosphoenolpyruvate synthase [Trichormus variabilis NIES-23]HBW30250.1 phosphoenolpyruvate synthase [Nostoc sp. UBA8866]MBD2173814.1 phosphoenolpyruvate synthase [Anabaena cylindrica FACHB-318]MBD2265623.1 phosphoenolpyruvate synthase [Anabaena sp. FACHB-709]MBD2274854.1 phosphoenolpyruvate synthase [Nostoc sp. PCC 7120 = FACHB-418]
MDKLYWLDQIKLQDRAKVGDKAFYLSRIRQRGYPVVPGFVVSEEVLRLFLETLNSSESLVANLPNSSLHLDVANWRQLQQVAGRLRQEIIHATVPSQWVNTILTAAREWQTNFLIFRPSLTLATKTHRLGNTSGLLDAAFCYCNEDAIAHTLKHTWSQLFRARSLLYWQRIGVNLQEVNLAILVQPVQNAIASGLLIANSSGCKIQATWGLGLALSQGEIIPDTYQVQQETGIVLERHLGNKMFAYRLDSSELNDARLSRKEVFTLNHPCIGAYSVQESHQQQYALAEEYLQQVITLGHQLESELGNSFTIEWTIAEENSTPCLYITQVSTPQSAIPNLRFIKGAGAARGRVTANAYVVNDSQRKPEQLPKGVILVVPAITPDWLSLVEQAVGIVTVQGGVTSHAAILARELGIPAVVNVADATLLIPNGERLLIDGDRGEVYLLKADEATTVENPHQQPLTPPFHPVVSRQMPMIATQLLVNLSQPSLIEQVQNLPVDGVGLLRSELMLVPLLKGQHPNFWLLDGRKSELLEQWSEHIIQFARAFAPRPVFYRSLDWRSHELSANNSQSAPQSILGDRGTFSYVRNSDVFELELTAIANAQKAGYDNIHLLLPFVRSVGEFTFCRQKAEQFGLTQIPQFQLWMMAEVPSVLFLLPEYVKAGVAGISIGTNDLTQLLLGADREQSDITKVLNERHPAVMAAIAQLIQMSQTAGIPCSICGQAPAIYPEIIDQLVQWGITSISVEPEAVERTYQAIARAEHRLLLQAARRQVGERG